MTVAHLTVEPYGCFKA